MIERRDSSGAYRSVDGVDIRLDGAVLRCTLDRAKTRNALDADMMLALIDAVEAAGQDERVRVIALTSSGEHFCAGADIIARNAPTDVKPRVGSIQRRLPAQAHRLVPLLLTVQTPVVTSVRGFAAGIGFHIALASDFCVASESARFWEPFLARGFTPDSGGAWLLPRLAGTKLAREMILLGRELSGTEAAEHGLIHRAVPEAELDAATEALIQQLAESPTVALGLAKWLMATGASLPLDAHLANEAFALELSSRSQDFREGLAAFREKRDPGFTGR
ncbi:MAG: enoyl-CoA hydratase-related protein [Acidimicrobiia bacterium]|jgi:2-(1,2-epoxy-1,2-dihydrophenyl)acetyl-CoA isomerase